MLRVLGLWTRDVVALEASPLYYNYVWDDDSTMPVDDDEGLVRNAESSRDGSLGGLLGASRLDDVGSVGGEFVALQTDE